MENQDDYLKRLIQRAEELMDPKNQKKDSDVNNLTKLPASNGGADQAQPPKGTKQKRFYSEEQKEKLRERLELAREKSREVRALKKNINEIKLNEKKEEKEEKKAKFNEQSLEDKLEKLKLHRQYNPPKQEIQGPKVEKPSLPPGPPMIANEPEKQSQPPIPEQVPLKISPPEPTRPKYFLPTMSYATKHKFINPL